MLLLALLVGCQTPATTCDRTGCDLRTTVGTSHRIMDDADLAVQKILADTALIAVNGETAEIVAGTTGAAGGLRVTVVSVDGDQARLLVAP